MFAKLYAVCAALLLASCDYFEPGEPVGNRGVSIGNYVVRVIDDSLGVACYSDGGRGISCVKIRP